MDKPPDYFERTLNRERASRSLAESILEKITRDLYLANVKLKEQYETISQHTKKVELFLSILEMSQNLTTLEEQLAFFIKSVCEMSDWSVGDIFFISPSHEELIHSKIWYFKGKVFEEFKRVTENIQLKRGMGLPGRVLETGKPLWIRDATVDTNFPRKAAALKDNLKSAYAVPIIIEDKMFAIAEFFFNEIQEKDSYLLQIVEAATKQFSFIIEKQQKVAEHKKRLEALNKDLILAARRAGMAEIATSVLHNIGNIMNSVNVSTLALQEQLTSTQFSGLIEVGKLVQEHQDDLNSFVKEHPQGKNFVDYISKVGNYWMERKRIYMNELDSISKNIQNIKEIIVSQQAMSGTMGFIENISIKDILEEAIKLTQNSSSKIDIKIIREYNIDPIINTDKSKLLQILVNLLRNSFDTLLESNKANKSIKVVLEKSDPDEICIKIIDTGQGILQENLTKIFSFGFTTKKKGHGFGLHASALSARELGGSLVAESKGVDQGSTFILMLPLKSHSKE